MTFSSNAANKNPTGAIASRIGASVFLLMAPEFIRAEGLRSKEFPVEPGCNPPRGEKAPDDRGPEEQLGPSRNHQLAPGHCRRHQQANGPDVHRGGRPRSD